MLSQLKSQTVQYLLLSLAALLFACGEAEEPVGDDEDQNESQTQNDANEGEEDECSLEYETFCEGADCCPENCYALNGSVIDVANECYLEEDGGHWCISPEIFTPGAEETNHAVPGCYYDDETELVLRTASPADGLTSTGGPLVSCEQEMEQEVFSADYDEACP